MVSVVPVHPIRQAYTAEVLLRIHTHQGRLVLSMVACTPWAASLDDGSPITLAEATIAAETEINFAVQLQIHFSTHLECLVTFFSFSLVYPFRRIYQFNLEVLLCLVSLWNSRKH